MDIDSFIAVGGEGYGFHEPDVWEVLPIEVALMAADAGLVRTDELAVAIAGTGRGADTAIVLRPANTQNFSTCAISPGSSASSRHVYR